MIKENMRVRVDSPHYKGYATVKQYFKGDMFPYYCSLESGPKRFLCFKESELTKERENEK